MKEFIELGFKATIVCVNEQYLDKSFCGRLIDESFVRDLPSNVDICGENGEYHSFVFDGPIFKYPVHFKKGEIVRRTYASPKTNANDICPTDTEPEYGFLFLRFIGLKLLLITVTCSNSINLQVWPGHSTIC